MSETIFRKAGFAFNAALLGFFGLAAFWFWSTASANLEAAGGLPGLTVLSAVVSNPGYAVVLASSFMAAPDAFGRVVSYGTAWFCYVAAAGCSWMALLGFRWLYHELLRRVIR